MPPCRVLGGAGRCRQAGRAAGSREANTAASVVGWGTKASVRLRLWWRQVGGSVRQQPPLAKGGGRGVSAIPGVGEAAHHHQPGKAETAWPLYTRVYHRNTAHHGTSNVCNSRGLCWGFCWPPLPPSRRLHHATRNGNAGAESRHTPTVAPTSRRQLGCSSGQVTAHATTTLSYLTLCQSPPAVSGALFPCGTRLVTTSPVMMVTG